MFRSNIYGWVLDNRRLVSPTGCMDYIDDDTYMHIRSVTIYTSYMGNERNCLGMYIR